MMTIHRWFDITPAKEDLKYEPVITTEEAWKKTIQWYKDHPEFLEKHAGIKPGKVWIQSGRGGAL
jgi:dTDP-D-glucose 4,6-dehydratase